ncbi:hypothetical protein [Methylotenera sp.]|uniref:hypothetical protein n=1 Tax=Methylotenera sp. TaxID=2051956 RepID=UPI0027226D06|nr:hypothetical protein [Methylotenera sp.]MDO9204979.1 hypothetical protein [Methylotenera sp.]MDO9394335.1 hypothetical protein [Methylotenera sp.]MDP1523528.1 hypothetical protein [Methylotenera sp.]MDP2071167.1 hypothetical protein [Methylotenera sp.]MDP2230092.1 hypothetical protein [Methylotenera sp.]
MSNIKVVFMVLISLVVSGCASSGALKEVGSQKIDRISEEELLRIMPKPVATVSLDDLVRLTKEGVAADQIIEKIKTSNSSYDLTPSQTVELNKQGVDSKVLDYIHTSRELALRNSIAEEINKREKIKQLELDKLKREQRLQRYPYDPFCRFGRYGFYPYGYGAYGSRFGSRFGGGIGFGMPLCW